MAPETPETDGFLAVIEKRIAALTALAQSYRAAVALGALGQVGEVDLASFGNGISLGASAPMELPKGALLGKSLPAAVELYLTSVRGKAGIREIANALRAGGVESTSGSFENVVSGALHRLKAQGKVLRFKDGWALAELYPATLRSSLTKERPTKTAKSESKKARRSRSTSEENKSRLVELALRPTPAEALSPQDIVAALKRAGVESTQDYVRLVLRRLMQRGIVAKDGRKYYRPNRQPQVA